MIHNINALKVSSRRFGPVITIRRSGKDFGRNRDCDPQNRDGFGSDVETKDLLLLPPVERHPAPFYLPVRILRNATQVQHIARRHSRQQSVPSGGSGVCPMLGPVGVIGVP
jgi:hypothetical protein